MVKKLYRVETFSFCAGFVVVNGHVSKMAPILRKYVEGKQEGEAVSACRKRGWKILLVDHNLDS